MHCIESMDDELQCVDAAHTDAPIKQQEDALQLMDAAHIDAPCEQQEDALQLIGAAHIDVPSEHQGNALRFMTAADIDTSSKRQEYALQLTGGLANTTPGWAFKALATFVTHPKPSLQFIISIRMIAQPAGSRNLCAAVD